MYAYHIIVFYFHTYSYVQCSFQDSNDIYLNLWIEVYSLLRKVNICMMKKLYNILLLQIQLYFFINNKLYIENCLFHKFYAMMFQSKSSKCCLYRGFFSHRLNQAKTPETSRKSGKTFFDVFLLELSSNLISINHIISKLNIN